MLNPSSYTPYKTQHVGYEKLMGTTIIEGLADSKSANTSKQPVGSTPPVASTKPTSNTNSSPDTRPNKSVKDDKVASAPPVSPNKAVVDTPTTTTDNKANTPVKKQDNNTTKKGSDVANNSSKKEEINVAKKNVQPAKNDSTKNDSTKSASTKNDSAKNASAKNASTKNDSAKNASTKNTSTKNASTKSASTKNASTKSASTKSASTKNASTKKTEPPPFNSPLNIINKLASSFSKNATTVKREKFGCQSTNLFSNDNTKSDDNSSINFIKKLISSSTAKAATVSLKSENFENQTPSTTTNGYTGYAKHHTDVMNQTPKNIHNVFSLPSVYEDDTNPVCISKTGFKQFASGNQTAASCKFNAFMNYDEYNQQMQMRKMKARNGLSYRTLNSYDIPFVNTQAFTGAYTMPNSKEVSSLFDNAFFLNFTPPAGTSKNIEATLPPLTDYSVELFGYVIVKTGGNSTNIKVSVSNLDQGKYVLRTWFRTAAILNYIPNNSRESTTVQNNEIVPIRIHVCLRSSSTTQNTNSTATNTPVKPTIDKLRMVVESSNPQDVIGLYTLIENNAPYVMNKYMYALSTGKNGADCYSISTNKMTEDKRYISVSLFETAAPKLSQTISIVDKVFKIKGKDVNGFRLNIGNTVVDRNFPGLVPRANPVWLSALITSASNNNGSGGSSQTLSAATPLYSQSGYYKVALNGNKMIVYGYVENPKCSKTATYPTTSVDGINAYNLNILPYNNRYSAFNKDINTVQPITREKNNFFNDIVFKPALHWSRFGNLYPTNPANLTRVDVKNEDDCKKLAAEKGASQAFFVQDKRNPKSVKNSCYYTTKQPAFGQVSLATNVSAPPQNITSSLYIRTQADDKGIMPRLNASNYSLGNAYQPIIDSQTELTNIQNMKYSDFKQKYMGGKENFVEGATTQEAAAAAAGRIAGWGGRSSLVNESNNLFSVLSGSLGTLTATAETKNGVNGRKVVEYDNSNGVSYDDAMDLYNLVHPNTNQTTVSGLEADSNELKMQYNNLLVVGSIAATTFAISAIVALSLR